MYGRTFPQSRQIAAYSTKPGAKLKYSGSEITMNHPFPPILEAMNLRLEEELGVNFNHVMLNRYDDGSIYIGYVQYFGCESAFKSKVVDRADPGGPGAVRKHSDNLNNLVIASISLGAERTFIMSPRLPSKSRKAGDKQDEDESLKGRKNQKWK
jgi:alkylated DNA repair dioxygenase AlkB